MDEYEAESKVNRRNVKVPLKRGAVEGSYKFLGWNNIVTNEEDM